MTLARRLGLGILVMAAGGLFLVVLPILAWRGELPFHDALDVFRLLLSWPVAIATVGVYFITRFHSAIDVLLRHVGSMRLPGGVDIQIQQPEVTAAPASRPPDGTITLSPLQQTELQRFIEELDQRAQLSEATKEGVEQRYNEALIEAVSWRWCFLDQFLVPMTKQVLRWFADNVGRPVSRSQFHSLWSPVIKDPAQRDTVLDVLVEHRLVDSQGIDLSLSTEGYNFLVWSGLVPPAPRAVSAPEV